MHHASLRRMGYYLTIQNRTTKATIVEVGAVFKFTDNSAQVPIKEVNIGPGNDTSIDSSLSGTCIKIEGVLRFKFGGTLSKPYMKTIDKPKGIPQNETVMALVGPRRRDPSSQEASIESPDDFVWAPVGGSLWSRLS